jgi:hypothetical protein
MVRLKRFCTPPTSQSSKPFFLPLPLQEGGGGRGPRVAATHLSDGAAHIVGARQARTSMDNPALTTTSIDLLA